MELTLKRLLFLVHFLNEADGVVVAAAVSAVSDVSVVVDGLIGE